MSNQPTQTGGNRHSRRHPDTSHSKHSYRVAIVGKGGVLVAWRSHTKGHR